MALFSDGLISDAADLQRYENDILSVASAEGIELGAKIILAQHDLADEVLKFLLRRSSLRDSMSPFLRTRELNDVVVSDPMRQWHVHKTLALVYRDAYYNQLNDRYQGKWQEYETLARASKRTCFEIGVGLVANPVPKAPSPTLTSVTGSATGGTFYAAVTWLNTASQEGAPSDFVQLVTSNGQQLVVAVSSPPQNVTGWNVYVGLSPATLSLQNQGSLIPSSSWTMNSGPNPGVSLPSGQPPDWFAVDHRVIERG